MSISLINRKFVVVLIAVFVGLLHFITGPGYNGPLSDFVNGYLIDILLPFAMYLVLGVAHQSILPNEFARGIFVFTIGAIAETLQYFGIPIFGRTFDLLDYLMFFIGIVLGFFFEKSVLVRIPINIDPTKDKSIK